MDRRQTDRQTDAGRLAVAIAHTAYRPDELMSCNVFYENDRWAIIEVSEEFVEKQHPFYRILANNFKL